MIGQKISHYTILEKLGEGGMGAVYAAEDAHLDRKVALKVLPASMASDPDRLGRFEREAKMVAALNHPNIVTIFSVEESEGNRFITMELVEGRSLDALISGSGLPLEKFLEIALPLADALSAAHQRGITHRDLKPANIMVSDDDRVKILDFGLAKLHLEATAGDGNEDATQALTQEGVVMGTIPYMSPEQVQAKPVDHRTDIFSLGVIFYEMTTGRRPFGGDSSADLISSILRDAPRPVNEIKVDLPNHLGRILKRCMEKDPDRRYQTALDIRNEIEELQQEARTTKLEEAPSVAVLPFADMSPKKDQDYFCEGIAEELINGLGRIQNLRVASRTSAFNYKEAASDIREIGESLNVSTILEGSVRKAGDHLRITAQLVNVADGYRLWSDRYDREMKDVFAIQDEIAESIVEALEVTLSPKERRAIQNVATRDVAAFDYYLKGRKYFYEMSRRSFEFAREMYSKSIELDPNYALAFAGIADCCSLLYQYADSSEENQRQAEDASKKALELDPELAEAHASRGLALSIGKKYDLSEEHFEQAISLNPKLFEAYYFYARDCLAQGKLAKSGQLFEKAIEVRPEDYQAPLLLRQVLIGMGASRNVTDQALRKALKIVEKHIELNPDDARAHYLGACALMETGEKKKALQWANRAMAIDPEEPAILYNVACVYSIAGEVEAAISYLEQAVNAGFGYREWLENDSDLDALRENSRFQALIARLGPADD